MYGFFKFCYTGFKSPLRTCPEKNNIESLFVRFKLPVVGD